MKAHIWPLLLISTLAYADKSERDYQAEWCQGEKEVVLSDRTRVDCLTDTHAIEIEFAHKWKEAIGQSLHYSLMTSEKAGIALILRKPEDKKYLEALIQLIEANKLNIKTWTIEGDIPTPDLAK